MVLYLGNHSFTGGSVQKKKPVLVFLAPLAYDYILKTEKNEIVQSGGAERCWATIHEYFAAEEFDDSFCVVTLGAGYSKTHPQIADPRKPIVSLAEEMKMYMQPLLRTREAHFIAKPLAWGTQNEIRVLSEMIRDCCKMNKVKLEDVCIITSSNPMHLHGRVQLWWWVYARGISKRFVPADHSFTVSEIFQETGKFFRDMVRSLLVVATQKLVGPRQRHPAMD